MKGFPLKAKLSFRNNATYKKLEGRGSIPPPPAHSLYHGGGMNLLVRPRVKVDRTLPYLTSSYLQTYPIMPPPPPPFHSNSNPIAFGLGGELSVV